jgi:hypothetical protein
MTAVVRSARSDQPGSRPASPVDAPEATDEMVTQAGVLVRQLAAFTRRQAEHAAPVDLNQAVAHAEPMLAQLVGGYLAFEVRPGADIVFQVSQADLDQLLTSLVIAGRDALPAGGSLILETSAGAAGAEPKSHDRGTLRAEVILTALGYGARAIPDATALALVAERCGGTLTIDGDEGWKVRLTVQLTAGPAPSRDWTWLASGEARRPLGTPSSRKVTVRD